MNKLSIYLYVSILLELLQAQIFERVNIVENSPLNTKLLDLRTTLLRHGLGQLPTNATAYASQQELFWPFVLDSFVIKLGRPLDREAICSKQAHPNKIHNPYLNNIPTQALFGDGCPPDSCCHLLQVTLIQDPTALPQPIYVQVVVQDVNDNIPRFPNIPSPYTTVRENIGLETKIWLPQALDMDSSQYSVTEYRTRDWIQGNQSDFRLEVTDYQPSFSHGQSSIIFQSSRPYLIPTKRLDREICDVYSFTLFAIDGGSRDSKIPDQANRALTGSVKILIQIEDVNDNVPTFDASRYEAEVVENLMDVNILEFHIHDQDIGENGRVNVNIYDSTGFVQQFFRVSLQLVSKLHGIRRINGGQIDAYSSQPSSSYYRGSLQLINSVDAELLPNELTFQLIAADDGTPNRLSSTAEVVLTIVNINDNPPVIAFFKHGKRLIDGRLSLPEIHTIARSLVLFVHVTDADSDVNHIQCELIHHKDMFSLEEASITGLTQIYHQQNPRDVPTVGVRGIVPNIRQFSIRTRMALDREYKSYYMVTVKCSDNEGMYALASNASLHITVTDVNDHSPEFDKPIYRGHITENTITAEVHLTIPMRVTDNDIGQNALLNFHLIDLDDHGQLVANDQSIGNHSRFFRIDHRSGRIWTIVPLDCEAKMEYKLLVIVYDAGLPKPKSNNATVIVTVDDLNDNPPVFEKAHYAFEVNENAPSGTEIGQVLATDRDVSEVNRKTRYSIRGHMEDMHLVTIDRTTGVLRTRRPIDRESRSSIALTVIAENELPLRYSTVKSDASTGLTENLQVSKSSLLINVQNMNDNPPEFTLIEPYRSHITFVLEHLGQNLLQPGAKLDQKSVSQNITHPIHTQPVCKPLLHRVTDKDTEPESRNECCIMELSDNFDGLFALLPESPNMLCALYRPEKPGSYKLTLIAKDDLGNNTLSTQVHFTVIIRSEPQDTSSAQMGFKVSPNLYGTDERNSLHGYGSESVGIIADVSNRYSPEKLHDRPGVGMSKHGLSAGARQTIVIIVMAAVAGVLCLLLLLALFMSKRCLLDAKTDYIGSEAEPPHVAAMSMKHSGSMHSTPSKSMACSVPTLSRNQGSAHTDCYADGLLYQPHLSLTSSEQAYELTGLRGQPGFFSPTIKRSTNMLYARPETIIRTAQISIMPTTFPKSRLNHESTSSSLLDSNLYFVKPIDKCNKTGTVLDKPRLVVRPPLPPEHKLAVTDLSHINRVTNNLKAVGCCNKDTSHPGSSNIYQTFIPRKSQTSSPTAGLCSKNELSECSGDPMKASSTSYASSQSDLHHFNSRSPTHALNGDYTPIQKPVKCLQRTNSERSTYQQASFV